MTKIFANAKCRQRLDTEIRWGSTFLMLEQIIKAENRGLLENIEENDRCPVPLKIVKNYVSILLPAYLFNVGLQRQTATIAEVIPSVLRAVSEWEIIKEKTSTIGNQLCDLLIIQFRNRFNYELNSHLYQVSCRIYKFIELIYIYIREPGFCGFLF